MTIAAQIARARFLFERGDFLPILVLVVAVQGTVLVSQSIAVLLLDTATIGKIRLFESMISIGVLLQGLARLRSQFGKWQRTKTQTSAAKCCAIF